VSAANLTIPDEHAGSAPENRIRTPGATTLTVRPNGGIRAWYDDIDDRWRLATP
jgi:hypothetical protein